MRVMVIVKANEASESGQVPDETMLADMLAFNEELVKNGIMLSGEGLHPSSQTKRLHFKGRSTPTLVDGPFSETKELIAGFWIWKVDSIDEAVEWAKKIPVPRDAKDTDESDIDIRPIFEMDDFGDVSPEVRAKEANLRAQLENQQS